MTAQQYIDAAKDKVKQAFPSTPPSWQNIALMLAHQLERRDECSEDCEDEYGAVTQLV